MTTTLRALSIAGAVSALACTDSAPPLAPSSGVPEVAGTIAALNAPPTGNFRYTPAARAGQAPFAFEVNMCKSIDSDPGDDLRFIVSWGDGTSDRGLCYLRHIYEKAGRYDGRACVSDRVLGSTESCEDFSVEALGDALPEVRPRVPALGLVKTATSFFVGISCAGPCFNPIAFDSGAIASADLASASRIVVQFPQIGINNTTQLRLGLYGAANYFNGSPSLAGQLGPLTVELSPSQFAGAAPLQGVTLELSAGGDIGWVTGPAVVSVYY